MTEHIDSPYVILRNTISGVAQEYTAEQAKQWLEHPVFGEHLQVVRTAKPAVLKRELGRDIVIEDDSESTDEAENATEDAPNESPEKEDK